MRSRVLAFVLVAASVTPAAAQRLTTLELPNNEVLYDAVHDRAYASVPTGAHAGTIAIIDPHGGVVDRYLHVGGTPDKMAVSDDGLYLYVSRTDSKTVVRVLLGTDTLDPSFSISNANYPINDVAVAPGAPGTIAVSWGTEYRGESSVSVFDDGASRPTAVPAGYDLGHLVFGSDATRLYAHDNVGSGGYLTRLTVGPDGVSVRDWEGDIANGVDPIKSLGGKLYTPIGVIDPERLEKLGQFPSVNGHGLYGREAVAPTPSGRLAYLYDSDVVPIGIHAFDTTTFRLVWSMGLSDLPPGDGWLRMTTCGEDCAVIGHPPSGRVYLLDAAAGVDLSVTKVGAGDGTIASSPAGLLCSGDCLGRFAPDTVVTLTATPEGNSRFVRWGGDPDCADGRVTLGAAVSCTAEFVQATAGLGLPLPMKVNDLVYSSLTGKVYASVQGGDLRRGNTVTAIDPDTGAVGPSLWVGSEPYRLAMSSDGGTLYVGLDGESAIRRVDVSRMTAGPRIVLPRGEWGTALARQLAVVPGDADSLVVGRDHDGLNDGIVLYTNGLMQPKVVGWDVMGISVPVQFSPAGSRLYAVYGGLLIRLNVGRDGIEFADEYRLFDYHAFSARGSGDLLYTSTGEIANPETLQRLGQVPLSSPLLSALPAVDGPWQVVHYLDRTSFTSRPTLRTFSTADLHTVAATATMGAAAEPTAFVACGAGRVAFVVQEQPVLLTLGAPVSDLVEVGVADADGMADITAEPADLHGENGGQAPFARWYPRGATITLTAPQRVGATAFSRWNVGSVTTSDASVKVTLSASVTAIARYEYPPAVASHVQPASGSTAGGTIVTITGREFSSRTTVFFGDRRAAEVRLLSTTTLVARAPAHAAGPVDLQLYNPYGGVAPAIQFTYVDLSAEPFGQVDTPVQGSLGIVGAIGVTGWALDDAAVTAVKIYRDCLAFENPANCQTLGGYRVVNIGDAAFLAGARPDVAAAFPEYPAGDRAGWGYLLLTNMLPHVVNRQAYGGQGSLTLYAFASDAEGHATLLGRDRLDHTPTTITLANDTIAKPFGAIDTPGQGETVSGPLANFGWALTPDADATPGTGDILVPTDGSTMHVFLDGVAVGNVAYNQCRGHVGPVVGAGQYCDDDVANTFGNEAPQAVFVPRTANDTRYRNLDAGRAAIGAYDIDTTRLANGLHTIAWSVTDSAGRIEGIGSRFFTVANTAAEPERAGDKARRPAPAGGEAEASAGPEADGFDAATLGARTGFDLSAPFEALTAGADGRYHVQVDEIGRVELRVGAVDGCGLLVNGERRPLPVGSSLDADTGTFSWTPPAGYAGSYDVRCTRGSDATDVALTIRPRRAVLPGEAQIRMFVDRPLAAESVSGPFEIAGWALDPLAAVGSGIGAVHVWARRTDMPGLAPVFLGVARLAGWRPDVAAAFAPQFARSGFGLVATLPPGSYDVTAYAWNRRTARWEDARSVPVTVR